MVHPMPKPLAQIADIEALDAHEGSSARIAITVPDAWHGATIALTVPRMLACDRCDGGGCDRCHRSGALRTPDDEDARQLSLTLPTSIAPTRIRLPAPFEDPTIEQLIVELRPGDASDNVRLLARPRPVLAVRAPTAPPQMMVPVMLCLAVIIVIGALVAVL